MCNDDGVNELTDNANKRLRILRKIRCRNTQDQVSGCSHPLERERERERESKIASVFPRVRSRMDQRIGMYERVREKKGVRYA